MTVKELSPNHCTTREYPELTSFYDLQLVVLKFCVLQNHTQGIKTKFVEVQLVYNVALLILSAMQQSESVILADAQLLCLTLFDPMDCSPPGSCSWDSPGKNTGVGCHYLL